MAPPTKHEWIALELVSVAAYVWYVYSVSKLTSKDKTYAGANFLLGWSRFCYGIARHVASWGIAAETAAYQIVEEEKL